MGDTARHLEQGPVRSAPRGAPVASSTFADVVSVLPTDIRDLQRLVGNQVTRGLLQRSTPSIQRELKIDSYAWSFTGVPIVQWGIMWATGAEALHKKLKQAFEVDLPAAITKLDATGEEDLKKIADSLRSIKAKYDDKPLVYKKTTGKLSGEDLDAELSPVLDQADKKISAKKSTLVQDIRAALGDLSTHIGGPLKDHRAEYDRINSRVPRGSTGSINVEVAELKQLAEDVATYETKMNLVVQQFRASKLQQTTTPTPKLAPTKNEAEELKKYLKEQKGWKELDTSTINTDPTPVPIKREVCERVIGGQIGALNQVLRVFGLTLESVHYFMFDHGVRSIVDLNKYLSDVGGEGPLRTIVQGMGLDGMTTLSKRGVTGEFIALHAGKDMITVLAEYKKTLVQAPQAAKAYDPFDGVDPLKDPLNYSTLEAFLQFHTLQIQTKGVGLTLNRTYNSRYEGENGIGGEYLPNGTTGKWVVHVHRGPNGGLKVGSIKTWNDRFLLGHSQKLTTEKLTAAGIPGTDTTRRGQ